MAGPFGQCRVVGEILAAGGSGAVMKVHDEIEGEGLRRLHCAQAAAIERFAHDVPLVDPLDGIGDRDRGHCRAVRARCGNGAGDEGAAQERPGRVVNENNIGCLGLQCFEAGAH